MMFTQHCLGTLLGLSFPCPLSLFLSLSFANLMGSDVLKHWKRKRKQWNLKSDLDKKAEIENVGLAGWQERNEGEVKRAVDGERAPSRAGFDGGKLKKSNQPALH